MNAERTVTVNLPKNIDDFLVAYAKLLKYKSVEDFLKEEIRNYIINLSGIGESGGKN